MEIGSRIRRARDRVALTQTEFARAVGVTRGLVGQWESHHKKPGREKLRKIAEVAGVAVDYLIGTSPDMDPPIGELNVRERRLVRAYRQMSERQQERLAEFVDEAVAARREVEQQRSPAKDEPVV